MARSFHPRALVLLIAFTTALNVLMAGPPVRSAESRAVVLTGWLHVEDVDFHRTTVEVEVNGETCRVPVSRNGRFDIALPAGIEAVIRFAHPHHLTKELVVDTHHADTGEPGRHARKLRFAVILQDENAMAGFSYAGPVGNIGFDAQGGCMVVERTLQLKPGRTRIKAFEG